MGRLFLLEFVDFDTKNFYVCRFCNTPFARNADVTRYRISWSNAVEGGIVQCSYLNEIANVELSDAQPDCVEGDLRIVIRKICCVFCSNEVGVRRTEHKHNFPVAYSYSVTSESVLFRINGQNHLPGTISSEEWFDPYRPVLIINQ